MKLSQLIGKRYKEKPSEAILESHAFLLRGGYIKQVANGIYSLLPPAVLVIRKIKNIIREEMNNMGGLEVLMPVVLTKELWEKSGRYEPAGTEPVCFRDRSNHDMVLAMTHEEAVIHLCRNEFSGYKNLPFMVYQFQTKFCDEPRSRGGLISLREFTMKDGYSFHRTIEDMEEYYQKCQRAYMRIFERIGLSEVEMVLSDSGTMSGLKAHKFMLLCDIGEDVAVKCNNCSYIANMEVAEGKIKDYPSEPGELEKVYTPGMKTIAEVASFLGVKEYETAKVVFYDRDCNGKPVIALIRGDLEINETKLAKIIGTLPVPAQEERLKQFGLVPGFASPLGVSGCRIVIDKSVSLSNNLVCGANQVDYHFKNFNLFRDLPSAEIFDIAKVREGDACPVCNGNLLFHKAIEVGNIFQSGDKYTKAMDMTFIDEKGEVKYPLMGCYGMAIGRLMSSVMEVRRDKFGPLWPMSISPWEVHINVLDMSDEKVASAAEELYKSFLKSHIEVIIDDRNESAGVQFADADLLGVPFRCILSRRNLKNNEVEWKRRDKSKMLKIPIDNVVEFTKKEIETLL